MSEETKQETPVVDPGVELPKDDFFGGNKMLKFAEQSGFFKSSEDKKPKEPEKHQEEKTPCPKGTPCGDKKEAATTVPKPEQDRKSKEIEERERLLAERESQLEAISGPLNKLLDRLDAGEFKQQLPVNGKEMTSEEELDLDLVAPGLKKIILEQRQSIQNLQGIAARFGESSKEAEIQRAKMAIEASFIDARKENPFDDVFVEDKSFPKLSEDLYAGLVSVLVKRDHQSGKQFKSMDGYLREAARGMNILQSKLKGNGSSEIPTSKSIGDKYPDVAKEIGQQAIANYLNTQSSAPIARSGGAEVKGKDSNSGNRNFNSLDEAMSAALSDPRIDEAMEQISKIAPH